MIRVSNRKCSLYVNHHQNFKGSNMYGEKIKHTTLVYAVYSYGKHFPMYAYDFEWGKWAGNLDKYSPSTSRHQSLARPSSVDYWVHTDELKQLISLGMVKFITAKIIKAGEKNGNKT